jgi:hypothetical protein
MLRDQATLEAVSQPVVGFKLKKWINYDLISPFWLSRGYFKQARAQPSFHTGIAKPCNMDCIRMKI